LNTTVHALDHLSFARPAARCSQPGIGQYWCACCCCCWSLGPNTRRPLSSSLLGYCPRLRHCWSTAISSHFF